MKREYYWGYRGAPGRWYIQPVYVAAEPFRNGKAAVRFAPSEVFYIDKSGKCIEGCTAIIHEKTGRRLMHLKEYNKALAEFTSSLSIDPGLIASRRQRIEVLEKMGAVESETILKDANFLIENDPENVGPYLLARGRAYLDMEKRDKALVDFDRAMELGTGSGKGLTQAALFHKADLVYRNSLYSAALSLIDSASKHPTYWGLRDLNKGMVLYKMGKKAEAIELWSKAESEGYEKAARFLNHYFGLKNLEHNVRFHDSQLFPNTTPTQGFLQPDLINIPALKAKIKGFPWTWAVDHIKDYSYTLKYKACKHAAMTFNVNSDPEMKIDEVYVGYWEQRLARDFALDVIGSKRDIFRDTPSAIITFRSTNPDKDLGDFRIAFIAFKRQNKTYEFSLLAPESEWERFYRIAWSVIKNTHIDNSGLISSAMPLVGN